MKINGLTIILVNLSIITIIICANLLTNKYIKAIKFIFELVENL